jgi:hypothetical protein
MEKIYLYLGRRDKKGIQILSIFPGTSLAPARITDVKNLHLPPALEAAVANTAYTNRFLWEVWVESATNFRTLKEKLSKRGYQNLPIQANPIHPTGIYCKKNQKIIPDTTCLKKKTDVMLERNSKLALSDTILGNRKRTTTNFHH